MDNHHVHRNLKPIFEKRTYLFLLIKPIVWLFAQKNGEI